MENSESYIDAKLINKRVYVSIADGKSRNIRSFKPEYSFYFPDESGKHLSIFGDTLSKFATFNKREFDTALQLVKDDGIETYESDVNVVHRFLEEHYPNGDAELNISIFDIEVDKDPNKPFSTIENPYSPITTFSMHNKWDDSKYVFIVPPENLTITECRDLLDGKIFQDVNGKITNTPMKNDTFGCMPEVDGFVIVESEALLLRVFIELITDADVISGWNSTFYDIPYIVQRMRIVLGGEDINTMHQEMLTQYPKIHPSKESAYWLEQLNKFPCQPTMRSVQNYGNDVRTYKLHGRIHLDYLELYRKFTYEELHSYALDFVLNKEINQRKVEYTGPLDRLYRNDFRRFVAYAYQDTMGLSALDDKMKFIHLANTLAHLGSVTMDNVLGTVTLIEQALLKELHKSGRICYDKKEYESEHSIPGACVIDPTMGVYEWIASYDFNSLYPTVIRMLNISPETIIGFVTPDETIQQVFDLIDGMDDNDDELIALPSQRKKEIQSAKAWSYFPGTLEYNRVINQSDEMVEFKIEHTGEIMKLTGAEMYEFLLQNDWLITAFGLIIKHAPQGILAYCMEKWYAQRVEFKKLAKQAFDTDKDVFEYYDRLQLVQKIVLNSTYGALLNKHCRFYDIRMGSSVTMSGRICLATMSSRAEDILENENIPLLTSLNQ